MVSLTPLGDKLRSLRCAMGWTQLELANRADVSERTVRAAERCQKVSLKGLAAIAGALGVLLEELTPTQGQLNDYLLSLRNMGAFVEGVRRAMAQQDPGYLIERANPDIQIHYSGHVDGVDTIQTLLGSYRGMDGVRRFVEKVALFWELKPGNLFTVEQPFANGRTIVLSGNHLLHTREGDHVWGRYSYIADFAGEKLQNICAVMRPLHPAERPPHSASA